MADDRDVSDLPTKEFADHMRVKRGEKPRPTKKPKRLTGFADGVAGPVASGISDVFDTHTKSLELLAKTMSDHASRILRLEHDLERAENQLAELPEPPDPDNDPAMALVGIVIALGLGTLVYGSLSNAL